MNATISPAAPATRRFRKVAVLMGGPSSERDVSVESGKSVAAALRAAGYEVAEVLVGRDARFELPAGVEAAFPALVDTGNALSDPLTGRHVLVACPHALRPLFCQHSALFEQLPPVELLEALGHVPELKGRFRLLPYSNLSGSGVLPVFRPESLLLDGERAEDLLIAVSPQAAGDGFEALL